MLKNGKDALNAESIGSATPNNVGTRIKAAREVIGMTRAQLSTGKWR